MDTSTSRGSIWGGALLITGSCIGAGMLGLPIVTGLVGFFPSMLLFFVAWVFMTSTGLMLVEVCSWFERDINLSSLVERTLGVVGKGLALILYLFLFYSLLVAYCALSGNHIHELTQNVLPRSIGSFLFAAAFGGLIFKGTNAVDLMNRILMGIKIFAFFAVIAIGIGYVDPYRLADHHLTSILTPLPLLIISFGFHNMIPSLNQYLGGDAKRVKRAILLGSSLTLAIYVLWQFIALGMLPAHLIQSGFNEGVDASQILQAISQNIWWSVSIATLAFVAILTSFVAQAMSLVHFLRDMLKIPHSTNTQIMLCVLALLPPWIVSTIYPDVFFDAINFAGGICTVILFGIFPTCMILYGRYIKHFPTQHGFAFGGKATLIFVACFSIFIFVYQLLDMLGISNFGLNLR